MVRRPLGLVRISHLVSEQEAIVWTNWFKRDIFSLEFSYSMYYCSHKDKEDIIYTLCFTLFAPTLDLPPFLLPVSVPGNQKQVAINFLTRPNIIFKKHEVEVLTTTCESHQEIEEIVNKWQKKQI